ncbi:MAG: glycosyltransferase family 4 protein [Eubacterium sp.]|nr:glycosyltransferase family 4 protein [Eubacterium sp.]
MKILILTNYDVGLYQFRRELIAELLKKNTVIISLPYGELVEPLKKMGCIYVETPFERRSINPLKDVRLLSRYISLVRKQKPELVITYTIKPNVYGGLVCRILKIPYAVNITGLGTAFQKQGMLRKMVTVMYKAGLKKAQTVFFENVENQQIFVKEGIVRPEQTCLLNGAGVNLEHFQVAEYPKENEPTRFLFIGRVMKEKGIDELFAAMKQLLAEGINCTLDVLGGYEEDYADKIKEYEKEGWLKYHGYQKDVRPFIAKAHCFILPSWHEGMANTNLECAAMGRPVITTRIHGCQEAVVENISGYLCKKKCVGDLYKIMKKFTQLSYEGKKSMGLEGRKHVEAVFDKKQVVKKTVGMLYKMEN